MSDFWLGVLGAGIGSAITLVGQWLKHRWETSSTRTRDDGRKAMLRQMLNNPGATGWRKMSTLSSVIGSTPEETARLLIEIEARGSETGNGGWAYLKNKPLPNSE